jgi:hypothetical protein
LFMTNNGSEKHTSLVIEPFDAAHEQNDYEVRLPCRRLWCPDSNSSLRFRGRCETSLQTSA